MGDILGNRTSFSIGFWGVPNLGDELICWAINDYLKGAGWTDRLLLTNSKEVSRRFLNLDDEQLVEGFWPTPEFLLNISRHYSSVAKADLVTIGGGGLIGDRYSKLSIPRYTIYALLCIVLNRPYVFIGLGILKVKSRVLGKLAQFALTNARYVYCRDAPSAARAEAYGVEPRLIGCAPDLTYLYGTKLKNGITRSEDLIERVCHEDYFLVNVREDPAIEECELEQLITGIYSKFQNAQVRFLAAEKGDVKYLEGLVERLRRKTGLSLGIENPNSLNDSVRAIANAKAIVCVRLHVTALAVFMNVPVIPLVYEDKVALFLKDSVKDVRQLKIDSSGLEILTQIESIIRLSSSKDNIAEARSSEVKEALNFAENISARSADYNFRSKFISIIILLALVSFSCIWSFASIVKRAIWGRG